MANGLMPLAGLCALYLVVCAGCSSDQDAAQSSAGAPAGGSGAASGSSDAQAGATTAAGTVSHGGSTSSDGGVAAGGKATPGGTAGSIASGGKSSAGASGGPPAAVDGRSIYTLECHGDSKDCNLAAVPCFGVGSSTPDVAAGWACANRCTTNADCSDAPSGAEAQASCVPFSSAGHCVLVCQNENKTFACPDGMGCYVPPKSPIGYCLWQ